MCTKQTFPCLSPPPPGSFSSQLVTACAMKAFHSLFVAQPPSSCLPAELNAQIITVSVVGGGGLSRGGKERHGHYWMLE